MNTIIIEGPFMPEHAGHRESGHGVKGHYGALGIEMAAHFVIMYLVMYTMIATLDHFYFNNNTLWMTLMMVTPMALIMMLTMRPMFPSRSLNVAVATVAMLVFAGSFWAMRVQGGIGNEEFLKSMIPHHSGAILMCEQASITDPEIIDLCREIVESQRREVAQMRRLLERY
ncbi:DUF305 domain-containing protein [Allosphingosinicella sp.]|uniref:DUF305 domain-containing protein n=1 Tax=Allosphingosinicella sp. TaxID=2823234 RepID=UPI002FC132D9